QRGRGNGLDGNGLLREGGDGIAGHERRHQRRNEAVDEQRTARGQGEALLIPAGPRDVARSRNIQSLPCPRSPQTGGTGQGGPGVHRLARSATCRKGPRVASLLPRLLAAPSAPFRSGWHPEAGLTPPVASSQLRPRETTGGRRSRSAWPG